MTIDNLNPALGSRHLYERDGLRKEVEKVIGIIQNKRPNVNNQV